MNGTTDKIQANGCDMELKKDKSHNHLSKTNGTPSKHNHTNGGRSGRTSPRCLEKPFLIGVSGGTASGKASVCARIMEQLGQNKVAQKERRVVTVSMDGFYRPLSDEDIVKARKGQYNFDHPDAFDHKLLHQTILDILAGETVKVPMYNFINHDYHDHYQTIYPADVVIFEGILLFYFPEVCEQFNMKLFVDTDPDTRLSRRVMRDTTDHGRNIEQILYQYTTFVKPAFEEFCLPSKKYADVIIPRGADNTVAIELIVQHIQDLLQATPLNHVIKKQSPKKIHRVPSVAENATRPH